MLKMSADETLKCRCIIVYYLCYTAWLHELQERQPIIPYIYDLSGFSSFFPVVDSLHLQSLITLCSFYKWITSLLCPAGVFLSITFYFIIIHVFKNLYQIKKISFIFYLPERFCCITLNPLSDWIRVDLFSLSVWSTSASPQQSPTPHPHPSNLKWLLLLKTSTVHSN